MADDSIQRQAAARPFRPGQTGDWQFRKAEASEAIGNCVEVARVELFAVRDSKDPESPILRFTKDEWAAFTHGVKAGEFDVD